MTYTDQEIAAELRREIELRQRVYPRWVQQGRYSKAEADRAIDILKQAQREYVRKFMPDLLPDEPKIEPPMSEHRRGLIEKLLADVRALELVGTPVRDRCYLECSEGRIKLLEEILTHALRFHP